MLFSSFLLFLSFSSLSSAVRQPVPVIVNTTGGSLQGESANGVIVFHSIPFGTPPIGNLRFKAPQAAAAWSGVKDVTSLPNPCPQLKIDGNVFIGSEDCLYLQVYVPENVTVPAAKSVLFWIFGGAYVLGDSDEFGWYDGTALAQKTGSIVVTHNYRVGPYGFLASDAL